MTTPTTSADEPQQANHNHCQSTSLSLSCLPDDIILNCLARVPRCNYLNLSCVSKTLRSLVHSPELNRLRSLLFKHSLYVSFRERGSYNHDAIYHWFTLRKKSSEYELVPNPIPFPSHPLSSSVVALGSEIYFVGGITGHSSQLWILDTRCGKFTQGPSMKEARYRAYLGVIEGKIYVIGGVSTEKVRTQVYDPKTNTRKFEAREVICKGFGQSASMERKVYIVEYGSIKVYSPGKGIKKQIISKKNERFLEYYEDNGPVSCLCVVENVLYACFRWTGLKWFDTKLNIWRSLVDRDWVTVRVESLCGIAEYDGKLAVLWVWTEINSTTKNVWCKLIGLDRGKAGIFGTTEWHGIVTTIPYYYRFHNCLAVSA